MSLSLYPRGLRLVRTVRRRGGGLERNEGVVRRNVGVIPRIIRDMGRNSVSGVLWSRGSSGEWTDRIIGFFVVKSNW